MRRRETSAKPASDLPRLRYLASARSDLVEILTYITRESGSLAVGQNFVTALREKCRHLAGLPGQLGRHRPELRPDIRSVPYRGYVIFFRYVSDTFEVVDILHGSRDIEHHFGDDDA